MQTLLKLVISLAILPSATYGNNLPDPSFEGYWRVINNYLVYSINEDGGVEILALGKVGFIGKSDSGYFLLENGQKKTIKLKKGLLEIENLDKDTNSWLPFIKLERIEAREASRLKEITSIEEGLLQEAIKRAIERQSKRGEDTKEIEGPAKGSPRGSDGTSNDP
jgi:hypothetical protein